MIISEMIIILVTMVLQKHGSDAICYNCKKFVYTLVAQLDRVSVSEAEGRGFDSRRAYQYVFFECYDS